MTGTTITTHFVDFRLLRRGGDGCQSASIADAELLGAMPVQVSGLHRVAGAQTWRARPILFKDLVFKRLVVIL